MTNETNSERAARMAYGQYQMASTREEQDIAWSLYQQRKRDCLREIIRQRNTNTNMQ